jgi:hypothetical protein
MNRPKPCPTDTPGYSGFSMALAYGSSGYHDIDPYVDTPDVAGSCAINSRISPVT